MEGLENLTKLHSLYIGKNKITRIQGLSTITNLSVLSMQVSILWLSERI